MSSAVARFLQFAQTILPADAILTDANETAAYSSDWTKVPGKSGPVVLPKTTEEVSAILKKCFELEIPVVPNGGRTGLAGGAVARDGEVVLNLSRMNQIFEVDPLSRTLRVQAGAVTQAVHERCAADGLVWPIDLASKGSCQIGGNLSTNAGGVRVVRYGMTRKWVTGLQVVTMQGDVIDLNAALEKNNTGYDLVQLIVGSEGTLAVVTEATLKLTRLPDPRHRAVFFFSVEGLEAIPTLFEKARTGPFDILAFEFFSDRCLAAVEKQLNRKSRLGTPGAFYVLIEVEGFADRSAWLEDVLGTGKCLDGLVAENTEDQKAVWGLREGITESLSRTATLSKYDLSVPVRHVVPFIEEAQRTITAKSYALELYLFGHFGDGSPHFNLLQPQNKSLEEFRSACSEFERDLYALLRKHGGSVSAEHGVGMLKKSWLEFSRSKAELDLFRSIKRAFDPKGLLNPGKLIDLAD